MYHLGKGTHTHTQTRRIKRDEEQLIDQDNEAPKMLEDKVKITFI